MGAIFTCDTSGTNPLFKITRYKVTLPKPQSGTTTILYLPQSGYGVDFKLEIPNPQNSLVELEQGSTKDYFFSVADEDTLGKNIISNAYAGFNKTLYKSVRIREQAFSGQSSVDFYVTYQSVFPNILISAIDQSGVQGAGPICSPELLNDILMEIALIKGSIAGNDIVYSTAESLPSPLPMDLTGTNPDNIVVNERHYVNNQGGKVVIRPSSGSFYGHDISIKDTNGNSLTEGTDYQVQALDIEATKICEHSSGVWRYIIVTKTYTGDLEISYHAFGGEVSTVNFVAMREQVQALKDYIDKGAFLTVNTVGAAPLINEMISRLDTLDRYYMSLEGSGLREMSYTFNAVKGTGGNSHWYSIAYLYRQRDKNDSNEAIKTYTNDSVRLKIRIDTEGTTAVNSVMDLYIYANVKNGALRIKSMEADIGNGYASPGDYNSLQPTEMPQFRLVWRTDNDYQYGAALQLKINIPEGKNYVTVTVENHNKAGLGGWILCGDANGTGDVNAENSTVYLPGNAQWIDPGSTVNAYKHIEVMPEYSTGKLVWAGSVHLHDADKNSPGGGALRLNQISTAVIDCRSVKSVTFCVFDRCFKNYIYKTVEVTPISENVLNAYCVLDELDNNFIWLSMKNENNAMVYTLHSTMGTKSMLLKRFDVRQISINQIGD